MKIKLLSAALLLILVFTTLAGCSDAVEAQTESKDLEIKQATIEEVSISIAESCPEQIIVNIKGGLEDSCTILHEIVILHCSEDTINISVTTERPKDAIGAQVYSFFNKSVNLGSNFTSGNTYTVDVNGVTATFQYP